MAITLPQRNYFTFAELQARWQCEVNDLRTILIDGQLRPSYLFNGQFYRVEFYQNEKGIPWPRHAQDQEGCTLTREHLRGHYYLHAPFQTTSFNCSFELFSDLCDAKKTVGEFNGHWWAINQPLLTLDNVLSDGVAMNTEIACFEGSQGQAAPIKAPSGRWPWGDHHTEPLGHLEAAAKRYWGANYVPSDATTASTNVTVSEWLQTERKVSRTMADSIASMLRPDGLPTGPRK